MTLQRVPSFDHEYKSNREVISVARSLECKCERLSAAISMQVLVTGVQVQQISIRFVTSSQCCELTSQNPLRWYTAKAVSRQYVTACILSKVYKRTSSDNPDTFHRFVLTTKRASGRWHHRGATTATAERASLA